MARPACAIRRTAGGEIHRFDGGAGQDTRWPGLSIHCAWGARYELRFDERAVVLDDEVLVIAAPQQRLHGHWRVGASGGVLAIRYPPGLGRTLLADLPLRRHASAAGWREGEGDLLPPEQLRVSRLWMRLLMRSIVRQIDEGADDPAWLADQANYLLRQLLQGDLKSVDERERLSRARRGPRRGFQRRLSRITDLIHSEYERRLTLADLAEAANLSTFHMLRSFKQLHGMTPYEYLQRRRLAAGLRILRATGDPVGQVAARVGFADLRSFRRLAIRHYGMQLEELRHKRA